MSVRLITTIQNFQGESTDVKPTENIPAGSTFRELNTGDIYIYSGSTWLPDSGGTTTSTTAGP